MSLQLEQFRFEVEDGIATVTMDRPPVNAHNQQTRREIIDVFDHLGDRDDVRVIILTATGKYFSAGADIKERVGLVQEPGDYQRNNRLGRESFFAIADCLKPVICAVNGPALGAGVAIMFCSDIILTTDDTYIQMPEINVGLSGGQRFLIEHLGRSMARRMYLTAARVSAQELQRIRVIEDCVPREELMTKAREIAAEIASKDPQAVQLTKRAFNAVEHMSMKDGYRFEQNITVDLSRTDYAKNAQRAFAERKRDAK